MVRVLAQDDGVHRVQRRQFQGPQRLWRKYDGARACTSLQKCQQGLTLSALEELIYHRLPVRRYRPVPGVGRLQTRRSGFLGE